MPDIQELTASAPSTPEQAAQNIKTATVFSMPPTSDKELNDQLAPEAEKAVTPTDASPGVHEYMSQSTEHTALAKPDLPHLNFIDETIQRAGDFIHSRATPDSTIERLSIKKMHDAENFTDADTYDLWQANQDRTARKEYRDDQAKQEKPEAFSNFADMATGAVDHIADFLGSLGGGLAEAGSPTGHLISKSVPYLGPGLALTYGFAKSTYDAMAGQMYNDASNMKHPDGTPMNIDETTKKHIAMGVGIAGAAVQTIIPNALAAGAPIRGALMASQGPLRMALAAIGKEAAVFGGMAGVQEATKILGEEVAKTYDGTHASFVNGVENAAANIKEHLPRVLEATGKGAVMGAILGAGSQVLGAAMGGKGEPPTGSGGEPGGPPLLPPTETERIQAARDVTPISSDVDVLKARADKIQEILRKHEQAAADPLAPNFRDALTENQVVAYSKEFHDIQTRLGVSKQMDQSVKVLQFKEAMDDVAKAVDETKMKNLSPSETHSVIQKALERSGIKKVFTSLQALRDTLTLREKGAPVEKFMDPTGMIQAGINAPVEVDAHVVAEAAMENPKVWEHVSLEPDGPTATQAKVHLEKIQTAVKTRSKILENLGLKFDEPPPVEPTNVVKVNFGKKAAAPPFNVEANVRRADEILAQLKELEQVTKENLDVTHEKKVAKLNTELDQIKANVHSHLHDTTMGDLLIGDWDTMNPDLEDSQKAASDYVNGPTFTAAIESVLSKPEVQKFNVAQQNARKSVADNIKELAVHEMNQIQDMQVEYAKEARLEEEQARIADDPNYAIVDMVRSAIKLAKRNKTVSVFQIDPKTLPDNLLKYTEHHRLKEHQLFKKGGANANDVASLLGVKDGEALLQILSKTPTREQVARARAAANAVADEQEALASVDLNHLRIIEALNSQAANAVAEMKFMREQEWPATKSGIKRIALPLPTIEELQQKARDIVKKTKNGSLNVKQYEVGARRSLRLAVNAILKNQVEVAFQAKEAEALNILLKKETHIAIGLRNRDMRFARKLSKNKGAREIINNAGPLVRDAVNEILNVWHFRAESQIKALPVGRVEGPNGAYQKWVLNEAKEGRGDFSMPKSLTDVRENINDLTFEQLRAIVDRLRVLHKEAKMVGYIQAAEEASNQAEEAYNLDQLAMDIISALGDHGGNNDNNLPPVQGNRRGWQRIQHWVATREELIAPKQNIYRELDRGNTGGFFQTLLDDPIEGAGKHFRKTGYTYLKLRNQWLDGEIKRINDEHGNVNSLEGKLLEIPELKEIDLLNNGVLSKGDLLTALANMGQQYTKDMLFTTTGGVSEETWQAIFDRELDTKDVEHMQGVVDLYKDPVLRAKTVALQKAQGREVTFIEGIPFTHRGVKYPGGYIRVRTVHNYTQADVKTAKDFLNSKTASYYEKKDGTEWGRQYSAETTDQGYLISRTDNKEPLDLSYHGLFDGLREIIHDHAYREPLANFFKIMDHPDVIPAMIRAVGEPKVNTIVSTNLEIAGRPSSKENGYFNNPNRTIKSQINKLGSKFALSVIWANTHAVIKQFEALPEMFAALGPKSIAHATHVNWMILTSPDKWPEMARVVAELDPNLQRYIDGLSDETAQVVDKLIPKKGQKFERSLVGRGYEMIKTAGFYPHQIADIYTKVLQGFVVIKHFNAGDHPLYPKEKLAGMTQQEQFEACQGIIQQLSTLTQIQAREELRAPIQKNLAMKPYTYFWNYPRNIINNNLLDARRINWRLMDASRALGEGGGGFNKPPGGGGSGGGGGNDGGSDHGEAARNFGGAVNIALSRLCLNAIAASVNAWLAGRAFHFLKEHVDWDKPKEWMDAGHHFLTALMEANAEHNISSVPMANSILYAIEHKYKYGMAEVRDPHSQALSSIATCLPAIENLLSLSKHVNRMQIRACLESEAYVYVPLPVRGVLAATEWWKSHHINPAFNGGFNAQFNTAAIEESKKGIDKFVKDPGEAPKELVEEAKHLQAQLAPAVVKIPEHAADVIKIAESGGLWNAKNGMYGFTKSDWESMMKQAPDLGLTLAGRTGKDTTQQERALDWSMHDNAARLSEKDIPVTPETIYGAHKLGVEKYQKLFDAPADAKVKTILGTDALKDHPELQNFKTIGQVKAYLNGAVEKGRKAAEKDNNLTSKTSQNED